MLRQQLTEVQVRLALFRVTGAGTTELALDFQSGVYHTFVSCAAVVGKQSSVPNPVETGLR